MPLARYDRWFGGPGGAAKAHAAMRKEYGAKRGEAVFYATMNKPKTARKAQTLMGGHRG